MSVAQIFVTEAARCPPTHPGYYWHLFLISSASVRSLPFLSFIVHIFAWNIPLVSPILFKRSLAFPILLLTSISLCCSLKKGFLSFLVIFCNSVFNWIYFFFLPCCLFLFFPQLFIKPSQKTILPSWISFPLGWFW